MQLMKVYSMLKGDEDVLDGINKFQKRPAFRNGKSVELNDSDYDPDLLQDKDDLNQHEQIALGP